MVFPCSDDYDWVAIASMRSNLFAKASPPHTEEQTLVNAAFGLWPMGRVLICQPELGPRVPKQARSRIESDGGGTPLRVLVVEDEIRLAENVARSLRESAGYAVDIAADGQEGLFLAESNAYDA